MGPYSPDIHNDSRFTVCMYVVASFGGKHDFTHNCTNEI